MKITDKYKVKPISSRDAKEWFLKKHYAKRIPISNRIFGLFDETILVGALAFGPPVVAQYEEISGYKCVELCRLVINEGLPKNVLSFFLSKAIKSLSKPCFVVSYADPNNGHKGYIYQATNWVYVGVGQDSYSFKKDGEALHRKTFFDMYGTRSKVFAEKLGYEVVRQKPKHRYFYIHASKTDRKKMMKVFPFEILPYPKGENTRYDASYKPSVQLRMDF